MGTLVESICAMWGNITVAKDPVELIVEGRVKIKVDVGKNQTVVVKKEEPLDPRRRRKKKVKTEEEDDSRLECVVLEWEAGVLNDMIADSIAAVVCHTMTSSASVKATTSTHCHDDEKEEKKKDVELDVPTHLYEILKEIYADVELNKERNEITIGENVTVVLTEKEYRVKAKEGKEEEKLVAKIEKVLKNLWFVVNKLKIE